MSIKKKVPDEIVNPSTEAINPSKIQVHKDPLFNIGDIVKHRIYPFRGVIVDVDPEFNNTEEWYQSIPKDVRPRKDQPFYHLLAESNDVTYEAYVSEQNLLTDDSEEPVKHPLIEEIFVGRRGSSYLKPSN